MTVSGPFERFLAQTHNQNDAKKIISIHNALVKAFDILDDMDAINRQPTLKALAQDIADLSDPATWEQALDGVSAVYSASLDPMLEGHLAFCKELGRRKDHIKHVVRVSCMGADTNTASYIADQHASLEGPGIPLMLQHYLWDP